MIDKQIIDKLKNDVVCKENIINHLAEHNIKLQEQLKRKEQENEELRQYHNKCCTEFKNGKQALLEKYNQVSVNFYNGDYCNTEYCSLLKAKEQEYKAPREEKVYADMACEQLKKIINEAKNNNLDLKSFLVGEAVQNENEQQLKRYEQTIEKIDNIIGKYKLSETVIKLNRIDPMDMQNILNIVIKLKNNEN